MRREIIKHSNWKPAEGGMRAFRIVLASLPGNDVTPYVTWIQDEEGNTAVGHYYESLEEAEAAYERRCERYRLYARSYLVSA